MKLSLVIPTHERFDGLNRLLSSVQMQDFDFSALEILIVFNVGDDPGREKIQALWRERFPHLRTLVCGKRSANRARNLGLREARADVVYFLDDDCELPRDPHLAHVLDLHDRHPEALAVGGPYHDPVGNNSCGRVYNRISNEWIIRSHLPDQGTANLLGGNVSYKKKALVSLNAEFDESMDYGGTETEFHTRLLRAGGRLLFQESLGVFHHPEISWSELSKKAFRQGQFSGRDGETPSPRPAITRVDTAKEDIPWAERWAEKIHRRFFNQGKKQPRRRRPPGVVERWAAWASMLPLEFWGLLTESVRSLKLSLFFPGEALESFEGRDGYFVSMDESRHDHDAEVLSHYPFRNIFVPAAVWGKWERSHGMKLAAAGRRMVLVRDFREGSPAEPALAAPEMLILVDHVTPSLRAHFSALAKKGSRLEFLHFIADVKSWSSRLDLLPAEFLERWSFCIQRRHHGEGRLSPSATEIYSMVSRWVQLCARSGKKLRVHGPPGFVMNDERLTDHEIFYALPEKNFAHALNPQVPRLSVIIPCFEAQDDIPWVLEHLRRQNVAPGFFEVILVDDGSRDSLEHLLRAWCGQDPPPFDLRLERWERHRGGNKERDARFRAGMARNLGAAVARGEQFCFLDSDILVPPDFIRQTSAALQDGVVLQAKRLMLREESSRRALDLTQVSVEADCYAEELYWENFKSAQSWTDLPSYWKYTCTYALAVRRDDFWRVGAFDPNFHIYGFEDVDLGYRLHKKGLSFRFTEDPVFHLFPKKRDWSLHFRDSERGEVLFQTCTTFFFLHLHPSLFREFGGFLLLPLRFQVRPFVRLITGLFQPWRLRESARRIWQPWKIAVFVQRNWQPWKLAVFVRRWGGSMRRHWQPWRIGVWARRHWQPWRIAVAVQRTGGFIRRQWQPWRVRVFFVRGFHSLRRPFEFWRWRVFFQRLWQPWVFRVAAIRSWYWFRRRVLHSLWMIPLLAFTYGFVLVCKARTLAGLVYFRARRWIGLYPMKPLHFLRYQREAHRLSGTTAGFIPWLAARGASRIRSVVSTSPGRR
ncbi:MAG: glycosyltransferase family 2 protein [Bdellovibrionaceae bacterium]|nr:glycosyltransferase family 2 protein [Pseudobdellovibrionaceae bacterium]MBX3032754.1 glycosyltransferase family 2 protein [Pseudobdellovibrionaceae bacterium]